MFLVKTSAQKMQQAEREAAKEKERQELTERNANLFCEFLKLPICAEINLSYYGKGVINAVNGMVILLHNRDLRLSTLPISQYTSSTHNFSRVIHPKEAKKILDVWTLMSRPYLLLDWTDATDTPDHPEANDPA